MENEQTLQKNTNLITKESNNYMSLKHVKSLIVLVVGLLAVGCLTPEQKQKRLRDSVVGTYERNHDGDGSTVKAVFLDNGIVEGYRDGEKDDEGKWKIINKEIHIVLEDEDETHILIINPIVAGFLKRTQFPFAA